MITGPDEEGVAYCMDEDCVYVRREPVSMGAVLMDLCRLLGIDPPRVVTLAMDEAGILA